MSITVKQSGTTNRFPGHEHNSSVSLHASVQTLDQLPFLVGVLFKGQQFQCQAQ